MSDNAPFNELDDVMDTSKDVMSTDGFDDLDSLDDFSLDDYIVEEKPLTEDLEGFASGFPDWDLHPPKKK